MVINEKEIEKAYNLFYDYMVKCYGCCQMNYDEFKQFVINMKRNNRRDEK